MGAFKKVLKWVAGLLLLAVVALAIWIGPMTYRAMVGYKIYETTPPDLPAELASPAILIFSKTNGFRSDEQIDAANAALAAIARGQGWSSYTTENAAVFNPAQLARFKAVVWNSVSGDVLTVQQRSDFKAWLEQGGGFVGLHGAGGDPTYAWKWYVDELIGTQFTGAYAWPAYPAGTPDSRRRGAPGNQGPWPHLDPLGRVVFVRKQPARQGLS